MNEKVKEGTDHWAFQSIVRPELPGNSQNPIDAFINKRLEKEGIPKNQEAEPLANPTGICRFDRITAAII